MRQRTPEDDLLGVEWAGQRVPPGLKVWDRDHREHGQTTGGTRACSAEECPGVLIGVRWADGKMTWPCAAAMSYEGGSYSAGCDYVIV